MESIRAFTRGRGFMDIIQRVNGSGEETLKLEDDNVALLKQNPDIHDEAHLFHMLNQLVTSFNKREKLPFTNDSETDNGECERKNWDDKIQNILRYGLLQSLRNWDHRDITPSIRQVLFHWWVTLLNNLRQVRTYNGRLEIPLLTTIMECISRIMDLSRYIPENLTNDTSDDNAKVIDEQDLNVYCNYLLLTCHYITFQLHQNSKSKFTYSYMKQFNDLLHAQLGQINALSFLYLPDSLEFGTLVVNLLTKGKFKIERNHINELFPWNKLKYKRTRNYPRTKFKSPNTKNVKCFNIIISYLQEEKTFLSFTWYFWHIILQNCQYKGIQFNKSNMMIFDLVNGSEIIINYTIEKKFQQDITKFNKILRQTNNNNNNTTTNNKNANIQLDKLTQYNKTNKTISEFIEMRFQMLRLWKEPLYELFLNDKSNANNVKNILLQYDHKQLRFLQKISIYDVQITNLILNKYLSSIVIDRYDCGDILNWDRWSQIIINGIRTLSYDIQINILKFLFNMWKYIPVGDQQMIIKEIVCMHMTMNFHYPQTIILINKLIVFKWLPDETNRFLTLSYLLQLQGKYDRLTIRGGDGMSEYNSDSLLLFDNNRKFVLTHTKIRHHYRKLPYLTWDKDFQEEDTKGDIGCNDDSDDTKCDDSDDNKFVEFKYDTVPIFKNVMMPYNNRIQQRNITSYNNRWKRGGSAGGSAVGSAGGSAEGSARGSAEGNASTISSSRWILKPNTRYQFDLSMFNLESVNIDLTQIDICKLQWSRVNAINQLRNFIGTFNLTMIEYYDFINLYSDEEVYIRIEV